MVGGSSMSGGVSTVAEAVLTSAPPEDSSSVIVYSCVSVSPGARDSMVNAPSSGCRSSATTMFDIGGLRQGVVDDVDTGRVVRDGRRLLHVRRGVHRGRGGVDQRAPGGLVERDRVLVRLGLPRREGLDGERPELGLSVVRHDDV